MRLWLPIAPLALGACISPDDKPATDAETGDSCGPGPDPVCEEGLTVTSDSTRDLPAPIAVPHGPGTIVVGDLAGTGTRQIYVGTSSTVTRLDGEGWTITTDVWTQNDARGPRPLVADLTGDGLADLVIGMPGSDGGDGQVVLFPGPVEGPVGWDTPHVELQGTDHAGYRPQARDFDGDGQLDLLVLGARSASIRHGPFELEAPLGGGDDTVIDAAALAMDGTTTFSTATAGDLDGDGIGDLVVSLYVDDGAGCLGPDVELWIVPGPVAPGSVDPRSGVELRAPEGVLLAEVAVSAAGTGSFSPALVGDLDGDGVEDVLAVGESEATSGLVDAIGFVRPFETNGESALRFGVDYVPFVPADFDGDGTLDLLQARLDGTGPTLLHGPLSSLPGHDAETCTFHVDESWVSAPDGWYPGTAWVGDLDGEGAADLVLATSGDEGEGWIQVVLGPV
jgi:hypothetical protein